MGSACRLLALLSVLALAEAVHTGATVELCRSTPRLATSSVAPHAPVGRRTVLSLPGSTAVAALLSGVVQPAVASGGATAGKTTSIPRAKLRYYDRIIAAVASFQEMDKDLTAGSLAKSKAFFAKDGPYDELMGAGYLLAVAFKIDSKIPPDKIPNVKMHKYAAVTVCIRTPLSHLNR
eukprot:scaffold301240_cov34-Tisochrysis_lutea.AAC.3